MKLVFALAFALLVAGAGSPKPEPALEAKGQWVEDLSAVKARCNMRPDRTRRQEESRSEHCDRVCRASCSDAELERVAEAFPEWHKEYTIAVSLCSAICNKSFSERLKEILDAL